MSRKSGTPSATAATQPRPSPNGGNWLPVRSHGWDAASQSAGPQFEWKASSTPTQSPARCAPSHASLPIIPAAQPSAMFFCQRSPNFPSCASRMCASFFGALRTARGPGREPEKIGHHLGARSFSCAKGRSRDAEHVHNQGRARGDCERRLLAPAAKTGNAGHNTKWARQHRRVPILFHQISVQLHRPRH